MINLLYCANIGVFDGLMLSLMSAAKKTKNTICAYIMTMDLRELRDDYIPVNQEHIDVLNSIVKGENPNNSVVLVDVTSIFKEKMGDSPNLNSGYTPYTLLRLLACEISLPTPILYVDADTMFYGDVSEICQYDINDYEFAAVIDYLGKTFISKEYINAGVLYLNLDKISETGLFQKTLKLCLEKEMVFPDQDAINQLVQFKKILPRRFNEQHKLNKDTIIQHFSKTIYFFPFFKVINVKQWQVELVQKQLKLSAYDDIYNEYTKLRETIEIEDLPPRNHYEVSSRIKQLKYSFKELFGYIKQNGGVFR